MIRLQPAAECDSLTSWNVSESPGLTYSGIFIITNVTDGMQIRYVGYEILIIGAKLK